MQVSVQPDMKPALTTNSPVSPFSITKQCKIEWSLIRSSDLPSAAGLLETKDSEDECLRELGVIGLIGGKQLARIYKIKKSRLKKLEEQRKIKKHLFYANGVLIPLYSLGSTGLKMMENLGYAYKVNQWTTMSIPAILRSLVFYQLVGKIKMWTPVVVQEAQEPFTGKIHMNGKEYHVLIIRKNEKAISSYFKFEHVVDSKRILVVAETVEHIKSFEKDFIDDFHKVRLTTDQELILSTNHVFQHFDGKEWVFD